MVAGVSNNPCYNFFIEPFHQGVLNLSDGFSTKTGAVAQNILSGPGAAPANPPLSLGDRVSKIAIGILLIIPIINTIVMAILKATDSNFIYEETVSPGPNPPPPGAGPNPLPPGTGPNPLPPGVDADPRPPVLNQPPSPIPAEEMSARKRAALERLTQIEQMVPEDGHAIAILSHHQPETGRFTYTHALVAFDLNAILQRYQTNRSADSLLELMDWAGVPNDNRLAFRMAIQQYGRANVGNEREVLIEGLLRNLVAYFDYHRPRVVPEGSEIGVTEARLKEQFIEVYDSIIDANNNCIDQLLSQVQTLALNVLAEGATSEGNASQAKLLAQAGLIICKYRTNLLKDILVKQNREERHMADLERVATQRVATMLNLQGNIFGAGAQYAGVVHNVNDRVERAMSAFFEGDAALEIEPFNPTRYLLTDLQSNIGEFRTLRNTMMTWARHHYDWDHENPETPQPHDTDVRMSEDADMSVGMGGNLTYPATMFLMETLGFVEER